jgi:Cu+-exporting ATPase
MAAAESGPSPELIDMTRRFWIGLVLSIPVVALEMGGHLTNLHQTGSIALVALEASVPAWPLWPPPCPGECAE